MLLVSLKAKLFNKISSIIIKKAVKEYIGEKSEVCIDHLLIDNTEKGLTFEAQISGIIDEEELMNLIKKALD